MLCLKQKNLNQRSLQMELDSALLLSIQWAIFLSSPDWSIFISLLLGDKPFEA